MIRLPFTFYLAGPVHDIINVGNLSPEALWLHGRLSERNAPSGGRLTGEKDGMASIFPLWVSSRDAFWLT